MFMNARKYARKYAYMYVHIYGRVRAKFIEAPSF